MVFTIPNLD